MTKVKNKILFQLDESLHRAILEEQAQTGTSLSEIVRRALKIYLGSPTKKENTQ